MKNMIKETITEENIISNHDFYFETPLYKEVFLIQLEKGTFDNDVDAYSAKNSSETTYDVSINAIDIWQVWVDDTSRKVTIGFYLVTLTCKRKPTDILRFIIYRDREIVFKLGQFPSLADLQFSEIGKKYDKVLPSEDLKNLKKAIGLAAHGIGAGSFVYLRRIFENLIFETYIKNVGSIEITEVDFRGQRMMDKVETLKIFLPSQLVKMKSIYSILGKGVHELTEEECLKYFAPIKLSIELILDQKIEKLQKQKKDIIVKKQLQDIQQELAQNKSDFNE